MSTVLDQVHNPALVAALLRGEPDAVALALPAATLLVPATAGGDEVAVLAPARGEGGRRLLAAFTDLEALQAWDRLPVATAVALPAARVGEALPAEHGVLLLNPAGPGTFLVSAEALAASPVPVPSTNGHGATEGGLVEPSARRPVRERARRAHATARAARERGELTAAASALRESLEALNQLKDHLHGAAAAVELAACHVAAGEPEVAASLFADAGERFATLGEPDLALRALLDGAEAALSAGDRDQAEALSVHAVELLAGGELSRRIVAVWRRLLDD